MATGIAIVLLASVARGTEITGCNQVVPDGETGDLRTDLSCAGAVVGIDIGEGSTLNLNGHTITGSFSSGVVLRCLGLECTINGGTIIDAPGATAVQALQARRLELGVAVNIVGCDRGIETSPRTRVVASTVLVANCAREGWVVGQLLAHGAEAFSNGGDGFHASRSIRGLGLSAQGNAGDGVSAASVFGDGLASHDNAGLGVRAERAVFRVATMKGNNGFGAGIDLGARRRPRMGNVLDCGKSQQLGFPLGTTWGVCTSD